MTSNFSSLLFGHFVVGSHKLTHAKIASLYTNAWEQDLYLTIILRPRMGSESIAHEPEGRMGY